MLQDGMLLLYHIVITSIFKMVAALVRERSRVQSSPAAPAISGSLAWFSSLQTSTSNRVAACSAKPFLPTFVFVEFSLTMQRLT